MLHDIINKTYSDIELEQIQNGVVSYFIATDDNYIKIGKSTYKSLPSRLSGLQTGNHRVLELIGILDGVKYSEDSLHKLFEKDRVRGEWFAYSEDIQQYLNSIKTSQLIKSKDSDDMVSLPIKLDRLAKLTYNIKLLDNVNINCLHNIITAVEIINIKSTLEPANFRDLAKHLEEELKIKSIDQIDWGKYSPESNNKQRIDTIKLLTDYYNQTGKVIQTYSKVKDFLESWEKNYDLIKLEIQSKFKIEETYSRKKVKQYLSNLYKIHSVKRSVSHRDLLEYFDLKEKKINGYHFMTILSKK